MGLVGGIRARVGSACTLLGSLGLGICRVSAVSELTGGLVGNKGVSCLASRDYII